MNKLMLALACALMIPSLAMAGDEVEPTPEDIIAQMEAEDAAAEEEEAGS